MPSPFTQIEKSMRTKFLVLGLLIWWPFVRRFDRELTARDAAATPQT